jgi:hypothetical protein
MGLMGGVGRRGAYIVVLDFGILALEGEGMGGGGNRGLVAKGLRR